MHVYSEGGKREDNGDEDQDQRCNVMKSRDSQSIFTERIRLKEERIALME